ncbi:hypothetical protein GCM10007968_25220 [Sporolactobacillus putidus]|uniref:Uncharacterized protein n=1 Tax=Sporolactobacillus putidus TaxID=492735 RepID=A0A917W3M0_9BACL|nr:hypothetical protein GCM10007968_25220 [Sporolactobacillus putidus]
MIINNIALFIFEINVNNTPAQQEATEMLPSKRAVFPKDEPEEIVIRTLPQKNSPSQASFGVPFFLAGSL